MNKPNIVSKNPVVLDLKAGTYWWCHCGLSKDQPFCDGSHKGTKFGPSKLEVTEQKKVALCQCKHTKNQPLCDGSHKDL